MSEESITTGVGNFLKVIFGSMKGQCHIESIELASRKKVHQFFEWPIELTELASFVHDEVANGKEVYFSPALFKDSSSHAKENVLGSRVVWATFDEATKFKSKIVPDPSIRVASGGTNCEHWYWLLNHEMMDADEIERVNQGLANTLDGNPTDWNSERVLRLPGTLNNKHGSPRVVSFIKQSKKEFDISEFERAQPYSKEIAVLNSSEVISDRKLLARYTWPDDIFDLFLSKEVAAQEGYRQILRLAKECAKMGMPDDAAFSALMICSTRWEVFNGFEVPELEIAKILMRAREEFPYAELGEDSWGAENGASLQGYTVKQFKEKNKTPPQYLFKGLLIKGGNMVIVGPSGVGKSQVAMQLGLRAANGEDFLNWKNGIGRPLKTLFLSLEMGDDEIELMWTDMGLYEDPIRLNNEHFILVPRGYEMHLNTPAGKLEYLELIKEYEPELIIIDSLSKALNGSVSTDTVVTEGMNLANRIRNQLGITLIFIHHSNKPTQHGPSLLSKDAQSGSGQISANATSQINLAPGDTPDFIRLAITKGRSFRANAEDVIVLERSEKLDFTISSSDQMKFAKKFEKESAKMGETLDLVRGIENNLKQVQPPKKENDGFDDFSI